MPYCKGPNGPQWIDDETVELLEANGYPVNPIDEVPSPVEIGGTEAPVKRRGWPKGKPRK